MYLYLLHQCNIRRWINPFEFKTRNLELRLGLSRTGIAALRNRLKQRGLIDFSEGKGKAPAVYLICGAEVTDNKLYKRFVVSSDDNKVDNTLYNKVDNTLYNKVDNTADHTSLIEEIRNKNKERECAREKINKIAKFLEGEQGWVESVCMANRIDLPDISKFLMSFVGHIISIGEEKTVLEIQDFKRRFTYWLYDEKKRRKNGQDSKNRVGYSRRSTREGNEEPGYGLVD